MFEGHPNEITDAWIRENTDFSLEIDIAQMLLFSVCAQKKAQNISFSPPGKQRRLFFFSFWNWSWIQGEFYQKAVQLHSPCSQVIRKIGKLDIRVHCLLNSSESDSDWVKHPQLSHKDTVQVKCDNLNWFSFCSLEHVISSNYLNLKKTSEGSNSQANVMSVNKSPPAPWAPQWFCINEKCRTEPWVLIDKCKIFPSHHVTHGNNHPCPYLHTPLLNIVASVKKREMIKMNNWCQ